MYQITNEKTCICPDCGIEIRTWTETTWDEDSAWFGFGGTQSEERTSHHVGGWDCQFNQIIPRCARNRAHLGNLKEQLDKIINDGREIDHEKLAATLDDMIADANKVRLLLCSMTGQPIVEDKSACPINSKDCIHCTGSHCEEG